MKYIALNIVRFSLVFVLMCGCAATSSPPSTRATAGSTFNSDSRGGRTEASAPERWNYDSLPVPSPSRQPGQRMNEIGFGNNSAELDREGIAICHQTARQMLDLKSGRYLLVGFSHEQEGEVNLGQRRADAVMACLIADGLEATRFESASFGSRFSGVRNSAHPYMLTAAQGVEIWTLND